ncbi:hypothetical protein ACFSKW_34525 [Nonomuraea mangrovi]|uniref:Carboxylesterase type B domain-containing protein n=1 Tax=Nonomuraea mangrovi TaxID=2316207 RepID=A0ABW4T493_9ACTN
MEVDSQASRSTRRDRRHFEDGRAHTLPADKTMTWADNAIGGRRTVQGDGIRTSACGCRRSSLGHSAGSWSVHSVSIVTGLLERMVPPRSGAQTEVVRSCPVSGSMVAGSPYGACHCIELPFVFGDPAPWRQAPMLGGEMPDALVAEVQRAWSGFVHHGDPGWGRGTASAHRFTA